MHISAKTRFCLNSSLAEDTTLHKISTKSVGKFLRYLCHSPTKNKQIKDD